MKGGKKIIVLLLIILIIIGLLYMFFSFKNEITGGSISSLTVSSNSVPPICPKDMISYWHLDGDYFMRDIGGVDYKILKDVKDKNNALSWNLRWEDNGKLKGAIKAGNTDANNPNSIFWVQGSTNPYASGLYNEKFPQERGTLEFWIYSDKFNSNEINIFDKWDKERNHFFVRTITNDPNGNLQICFQEKGNPNCISQVIRNLKIGWHYLVIKWDTSIDDPGSDYDVSYAVFLNGVRVKLKSLPEGWKPNEQYFTFGAYGETNGEILIDEVAIHQRTLTLDEISKHYENIQQGIAYCSYEEYPEEIRKAIYSTPDAHEKIITWEKSADDIEAFKIMREDTENLGILVDYFLETNNEYVLSKAKEILLDYATTVKPTNNAVDNREFANFAEHYGKIRDNLNSNDASTIDNFLLSLARKIRDNKDFHLEEAKKGNSNVMARFCDVVGTIAIILDDSSLKNFILNDPIYSLRATLDRSISNEESYEIKERFINKNPNCEECVNNKEGCTTDFCRRDSLGYNSRVLAHSSHLIKIGERYGGYNWNEEKTILKKSINFIVPYAIGEKEHLEYVYSSASRDEDKSTHNKPYVFDEKDLQNIIEAFPEYDYLIFNQGEIQEICHNKIDDDFDGYIDCQDVECPPTLECGQECEEVVCSNINYIWYCKNLPRTTTCGIQDCPNSYCENNNFLSYEDNCIKYCAIGVCQDCSCDYGSIDCGKYSFCTIYSCGGCEEGHANCNEDPGDGCEIDLKKDEDNCGGCGILCSANEQCINENCVVPEQPECSQDSDCGVDEFINFYVCWGNDLYQTYREYTCNNPGTALASCSHTDKNNLKESCGLSSWCDENIGSCTECPENYANCNDIRTDGCEVRLTTNENHCGSCNAPCEPNEECINSLCTAPDPCANTDCGVNAYCKVEGNNGVCYCDASYDNCDNDWSTGCEANLLSDRNNCKNCNIKCFQNQICSQGSCIYTTECGGKENGVSCNNGYGKCYSEECYDLPSCSICETEPYVWNGLAWECSNKESGISCGSDPSPCKEKICDGSGNCIDSNKEEGIFCGTTSTCQSDFICNKLTCNSNGQCSKLSDCSECPNDYGICGESGCSSGACYNNILENKKCGTVNCGQGASGSCEKTCSNQGDCENCIPDTCSEVDCNDGRDNDNDGKADMSDSDCNVCAGKSNGESCDNGEGMCCNEVCAAKPTSCSDCKNENFICSGNEAVCENEPSGTQCSSDALSCTSNECDGQGNCEHNLYQGMCLISGTCYSNLNEDPNNQCQLCQGGTSWSNKQNGEDCSDGNSCTINDKCQNGQCTGEPIICGNNAQCSNGICICKEDYIDCDNNINNGCEALASAGCPECQNDERRECLTSESCHGEQTCKNLKWGECIKGEEICSPNSEEDCFPIFDNKKCYSLIGVKTCDSCGTGYSKCYSDASCCPGEERTCRDNKGCFGEQICARGSWDECKTTSKECAPDETELCKPEINGKVCKVYVGQKTCNKCGQWEECTTSLTECPPLIYINETVECQTNNDCSENEICFNNKCIEKEEPKDFLTYIKRVVYKTTTNKSLTIKVFWIVVPISIIIISILMGLILKRNPIYLVTIKEIANKIITKLFLIIKK